MVSTQPIFLKIVVGLWQWLSNVSVIRVAWGSCQDEGLALFRELLLPASCCCLHLGQPEHLHVCRGDADAAGSGALLLGTAAFQLFSCFLLEGFTARKQGATLLPVAELWNCICPRRSQTFV